MSPENNEVHLKLKQKQKKETKLEDHTNRTKTLDTPCTVAAAQNKYSHTHK